jgi:hypothetical protein
LGSGLGLLSLSDVSIFILDQLPGFAGLLVDGDALAAFATSRNNVTIVRHFVEFIEKVLVA